MSVIWVVLLTDLLCMQAAGAATVGGSLIISFKALVVIDLLCLLFSHILRGNLPDIFLVNNHLISFGLPQRLLHNIVLRQLYRHLDNRRGFLEREAVVVDQVKEILFRTPQPVRVTIISLIKHLAD